MNNPTGVFRMIVDQMLLGVHTAFLGKIVSFQADKKTATVQPLTLEKQVGQNGSPQSVLTNIPVLNHACFKYSLTDRACLVDSSGATESRTHMIAEPLKPGDLCLCVTCERDITEARRGNSVVPPLGHHERKDSIVIGVIG